MMNKSDQEFLIQNIRTQYIKKEHSRLDALKELDARVKRPAKVFAYILGITGTLVLGVGMCFAMEVIGGSMMAAGVVIGIVGILMVSVNYAVYKKILGSRKKKYGDEIIALSDDILKS